MLNSNYIELKGEALDSAISQINDLIAETAGMAGGLATLEGVSREGILPFDKDILETCKEFFLKINNLLSLQKSHLERQTLIDAVMEDSELQIRKLVEKARKVSPFSRVSTSA